MRVETLLRLPAFLWGVGVLFWCFQGACLTGFIKWWRLSGPRNDVQGVLDFLKFAFRYRLLKLPGPEVHQGKVVYLTNHRGWADFFVDMWALGGRALPLSRLAVGMAFPAFTSSLLAIKSILLFKRSGIKDTEKFNRWLDAELAEGPQNSLLVYPEGTRSLKSKSLPLKRGMLRYAFTRRLPVQVMVTAGKEEVLNERKYWMHLNRTLVIGCAEVIDTSRFEDFEDFMATVQKVWDTEWERVQAAPRTADLPPLVPRFPERQYSPSTLAIESAALAFWMAVLLTGAYYAAHAVVALAAIGPVGMALVAGLGLYIAASLAAAALLPSPQPRGSKRSSVDGSGVPGQPAVAVSAAAASKED